MLFKKFDKTLTKFTLNKVKHCLVIHKCLKKLK